jgi:hypothetical protein
MIKMKGVRMEPHKMLKEMIDFNKTTYDNSYKAMALLQEQMENTMSTFLDQAAWIPEEGKRVIIEWLETYQKGREDFRKLVDENFKRVEAFFADTEKTQKQKSK